jgi:hypothetical protein
MRINEYAEGSELCEKRDSDATSVTGISNEIENPLT